MTAVEQTTAPLVVELATALRDAGVTYCHWKSNAFIWRAERAETDLDLLVAQRDVRTFTRVLSACGFVAAQRPDVAPVPGVVHYFGYDAAVDRFVHVHAHHQLVVGHDRTKNYRLPIATPFLASASMTGVLPVPSAEFEYVVFVIRMVLKYAIVDELGWNALRGRRTTLQPSEQDELDQLRRDVDPKAAAAIIDDHLSFVGRPLFAAAEDVVCGDTSLRQTMAVARAMQSRLAAYARHAPRVDAALRVGRRVALSVRRRTNRRSAFRLASGGAIVAVMGGDGSGKSTAVTGICEWLGRHFDVVSVHLGKPPWSWTTSTVRGGLKVGSVGAAVLGVLGTPGLQSGAARARQQDQPVSEDRRLVWFACKARDRYLAYRRASRAASNGSIVVSDRFPHPALHATDIPQIRRLTEGRRRSGFVRWLMGLEDQYHELVALPDLAIVLKVDPVEAARRKTDEPYDYVKQRAAEIWGIDWADAGVQVVDASRPPDEVMVELKALIWAALS